MPPIFVWGVVTGDRGVLLVPADAADGWMLPGGVLRDDDESVESAMVREIQQRLGVRLSDEPDFLSTEYERRADGSTLVHNLFHIPEEDLGNALDGLMHRTWLDVTAGDDLALADWLRDGLERLLGDSAATATDIDMEQLQADLRAIEAAAPVFIVTGPAGAGKSTVARELCRRFPRAAHIDVDQLRRLVISGYASPVPGNGEPGAAAAQTDLATANATDLARNFSAAGFVTVIDEVLSTQSDLDNYLVRLRPETDIRFITLMPASDALAARDAGRAEGERMGDRSAALHRIFAANGETRGLRLDTSSLSVEETVDVVLERLGQAQIGGRMGGYD